MVQRLRLRQPLLRGSPCRWPSDGGGVGVGASRARIPHPLRILPSGPPPTLDWSSQPSLEATLARMISVRVPAWRRAWPWLSRRLPSAPSLPSPCVVRGGESFEQLRPQPRARSPRTSGPHRRLAVTSRWGASGVAVVRGRKGSRSPRESERWLPSLLVRRERPGSGSPTWRSRLICLALGHLDAAVAVVSWRACPQGLQPPGPMLLRSFRNPFSWEHLAPGRRGLTLVAVATAPTTLGSLGLAAGIASRRSRSEHLFASDEPRSHREGGSSGRRHLRSG